MFDFEAKKLLDRGKNRTRDLWLPSVGTLRVTANISNTSVQGHNTFVTVVFKRLISKSVAPGLTGIVGGRPKP